MLFFKSSLDQPHAIFAGQGFLIRAASQGPFMLSKIKSRDFSLDFDWGLLKPFDQSKITKHTWFNQQCFPNVYSRVFLLRLAQNPIFLVFLFESSWCMYRSFNGAIPIHKIVYQQRHELVDWGFTAPSLSITFEWIRYICNFHIIPIHWIHWALKRSSNLSKSMSTEAAISGARYVIVRNL